MIVNNSLSDQLYNWSDIHEESIYSTTTKKEKHACKKAFLDNASHFKRIHNRTLQAMWETRMQMCRWPWTWPKVLFISQPIRQKTGNGLCASRLQGTSNAIFKKLQTSSRHSGTNMQHQSRNTASQRTSVRNIYVYHCQQNRFRVNRNYICQYSTGFISKYRKLS